SAFQAYRQQGTWTGKRTDNVVDGGAPFYRSYATKDGKYVAVGAVEPHFYANLLSVMGLDPSSLPGQNDRRDWRSMRELFASVFQTAYARRMGRARRRPRRVPFTGALDRRGAG